MHYALRSGLLALVTLGTVVVCQAHDPHAQHRHETPPAYVRSVQAYQIPDLRLVRDDGTSVASTEIFAADRPVVVSFIFTSCSAICPVLSATLAQMRTQLGENARNVRIVSVTIDPENDTPARLHDYARQFQADGNWRFYTGEPATIVALQKAFNAYRGDKNNHVALAFIRPAGETRWIRLEGFTSAAELAAEIKPSGV